MVCKRIRFFTLAFGLCLGILAFSASPADAACFGGVPNGNVTGAEECDDGNTNNVDACANACTITVCGNSRVDPPENCDPSSGTNAAPVPNETILKIRVCSDCFVYVGGGAKVVEAFDFLGREFAVVDTNVVK